MNKLIALVAAFAATTSLYATSAEAGCGHGYHRLSYRAAAKPRQQSVAAVKQDAKDDGKTVAEAAPVAAKAETVALNTAPVSESSSIVTGTPKIADAKAVPAKADAKAVEKVATAATGAKDCKQFFPTAGITLSVRCE